MIDIGRMDIQHLTIISRQIPSGSGIKSRRGLSYHVPMTRNNDRFPINKAYYQHRAQSAHGKFSKSLLVHAAESQLVSASDKLA